VLIDTTMLQNILGHPAPVVANVQTEFVGSENDLSFNAGCACVAKRVEQGLATEPICATAI
jgi:hypothetical protein